jgi:excinuclease ABC subunit C
LEAITGIGDKTFIELLTHFRSLKRIKEASLEELSKLVGQAKANIIYKNYHQE